MGGRRGSSLPGRWCAPCPRPSPGGWAGGGRGVIYLDGGVHSVPDLLLEGGRVGGGGVVYLEGGVHSVPDLLLEGGGGEGGWEEVE